MFTAPWASSLVSTVSAYLCESCRSAVAREKKAITNPESSTKKTSITTRATPE